MRCSARREAKIAGSVCRPCVKHYDGFRSDAFAPSRKAEPLRRGGFHAHGAQGKVQQVSSPGAHVFPMRLHFGSFTDHRDVAIADDKSLLCHETFGLFKKKPAVSIFPAVIAGGEMIANITQGGGAQNCIRKGMPCRISIGMSLEACHMRDLHTAQGYILSRFESMYIKTLADTYLAGGWCHQSGHHVEILRIGNLVQPVCPAHEFHFNALRLNSGKIIHQMIICIFQRIRNHAMPKGLGSLDAIERIA